MAIDLFDRTKAIRQEQTIRREQRRVHPAQPRPSHGFGAGFAVTNDVAIVSRSASALVRDRGEWDDQLAPWSYLKEQGGYDDFLSAAARDRSLQNAMVDARNGDDLIAIADLWRENQERMTAMMNDPIAGAFGAVMGAIMSPSNLIPGAVLARIGGRAAYTTVQLARAARAARAAQGAGLEASLNTLLIGVEDISDPGIGSAEYMLGAGIGAVLGGSVGALMKPRVLPTPAKIEAPALAFDRTTAKLAEPTGAARAPVGGGAAETPGSRVEREGARELRDDDFAYSPHGPDPRESSTWFQRVENQLGHNGTFNFLRGLNQAWQGLNLQHGQTGTFKKLNQMMTKMLSPSQNTLGELETALPRQRNFDQYMAQTNIMVQGSNAAITRMAAEINELVGDLGRSARQNLVQDADGTWGTTRGAIQEAELANMLSWYMLRRDELWADEQAGDAALAVARHFMGGILPDDDKLNQVALKIQQAAKPFQEINYTVGAKAKELGTDADDMIDPDKLAQKVYFSRHHQNDGYVEHYEDAIDMYAKEIFDGNLPDEDLATVIEELKTFTKQAGRKFDEVYPELANEPVWDDLPTELQEELLDWMAEIRAGNAEEAMKKLDEKINKALTKDYKDAEGLVLGKLDTAIAKSSRKAKAFRTKIKKLDKEKGKAKEAQALRKEMADNDRELNKLKKEASALSKSLKDRAVLKRELDKLASKGGKKGSKAAKARKAVEKGERTSSKLGKQLRDPDLLDNLKKRMDPHHMARRIVNRLVNGMGEADETAGIAIQFSNKAGKAGSLKTRSLPLKKAVADFDPLLNKTLDLNLQRNRDTYIQAVETRNFFMEEFGDTEPMEVVRRLLDESEDGSVVQDRARIEKMMGRVVKRMLGTAGLEGTGKNKSMRWLASNFKNVAVPLYLGSSALLFPADVGLLHIARESPGMRKMAQQMSKVFVLPRKGARAKAKLLSEMGENRLLAMMLSVEQSSNAQQVGMRRLDLDPRDEPMGIGVPGSRIYHASTKITRATKKLAEWTFELNLQNQWNTNMDWGFRELYQADLLEFSKKSFTDLPEAYRLRMQAVGVGEADWKRLQRMHGKLRTVDVMGKPYTTVDFDALSPEDLVLYKRAIDGYASRGIIHPGYGDTPSYADDPIGAMMFQFQGFGYAAQQKLIRPMFQKGLKDPLVIQTLLAMFAMSFMFNMARAQIKGEAAEWFESFDTHQGRVDRLYELWARSPLNVSSAGMITEIITNLLSPLGVLPSPARRRGGIMGTIGGPTAGTIENGAQVLPGILEGIMKGSAGDIYSAAKPVIPFSSHFGARALESTLSEE